MVLVDNSAWIEWLIGSPIGETPVGQMPDRDEWLVPTMVQLEAAKWLAREADEHEEDQVIAFTRQCRVVPFDTKIALAAARACRDYRLATADAIIYATACARNAMLLTCDQHFRGLPGVTLIEKIRG